MMFVFGKVITGKSFYVAEIVGKTEYKVTRNFALLDEAEAAKRRIKRTSAGNYVIRVA